MFARYDNEESRFARILDKVAGNTETSLQKLNNAIEILQDSPFGAIYGFYIALESRKSYVKQYYGIDGTELIRVISYATKRQSYDANDLLTGLLPALVVLPRYVLPVAFGRPVRVV